MSLSGPNGPPIRTYQIRERDRVDDLGRDEHEEQQAQEDERPLPRPPRERDPGERAGDTVAIRAAPSAARIDVKIALRIVGLSSAST